jgi:hypothetical protein
MIAKIKYQGNRVMLVAIGSCFAVHIVTFLPITCIYHIVTLAENCMFESFLKNKQQTDGQSLIKIASVYAEIY